MSQYKDRLEKIEEALYEVMPPSANDDWMAGMTSSRETEVPIKMIDTFHAPGVELLSRGGKRWRPLVMVLTNESAGGQADEIYPLTPLVELAHNGSLIVDDIEDKSVERRGKPAVHLLYGEDLSINAGNLMYFNATGLVARLDKPAELRFSILDSYCENLRRLHFGQGLDIQWHNDHDQIPAIDVYLQMCRFKTGALARFAAQVGVLVAGGSRPNADTAGDIWERIGVGFQILDDVKNLTTGNPGKQRGDDVVEGKKSLPVIMYYNSHKEEFPVLARLFDKAGDLGMPAGVSCVEEAISILEKSGSIKAAGEHALSMMNEALDDLKNLFPQSEALDLQQEIVESFIRKML